MPQFTKAIVGMTTEQQVNMRDNIILQLAKDNQEALAHLLRAFLVKNRDVEFIRQKVTPQLISNQCKIFVREQASVGLLTRKQFENVQKVMTKSKQAVEFAEIVKSVLLENITLMEECLFDDLDAALVPCKLTCAERLTLAKKTA